MAIGVAAQLFILVYSRLVVRYGHKNLLRKDNIEFWRRALNIYGMRHLFLVPLVVRNHGFGSANIPTSA